MYNLPYFKENDKDEVLQFMKDHPFIFLTGVDSENKLVATQVPVFIDEREGKLYLSGHMMRNTDHHKAFETNPAILAVFNGPHVYVSATWYDNPHQASTWNYMSVHAKGQISFGGREELVTALKRLTLHYENNNTASTTVFDNLPDEYREPLMKAIVPFEIEVTAADNVFKLSQNRDEKSYDNIIAQLEKQDEAAKYIAGQMRARRSQLFKDKP